MRWREGELNTPNNPTPNNPTTTAMLAGAHGGYNTQPRPTSVHYAYGHGSMDTKGKGDYNTQVRTSVHYAYGHGSETEFTSASPGGGGSKGKGSQWSGHYLPGPASPNRRHSRPYQSCACCSQPPHHTAGFTPEGAGLRYKPMHTGREGELPADTPLWDSALAVARQFRQAEAGALRAAQSFRRSKGRASYMKQEPATWN